MKILVCVKQVPESDTAIWFDAASATVRLHDSSDFKMNRLDEFAVEEAVLLKEAYPDTVVDIISVGPERCADVIKRALGMGADGGIHILTESDPQRSSLVLATWIAYYARENNYELIFCGAMSEDCMQAQVGPMIAALLALPCATSVIREKLSLETKTVYIEREIEGGSRDTLELTLPAVLTIQSGINRPRYPSLSNLLRANRQKLHTLHAADLMQPESREEIIRVAIPAKSRAGMFLAGSQQEKAKRLLTVLRDKELLG